MSSWLDPVLLPVDRLSAAARRVWAKHDRKTDSWLPLWRHMADSGAVAGLLWERWLPRSVRGLVSEVLPGGEEDARVLVRFLAAVHDIGKATPAFACQVESLAGPMRDAGLGMPTLREYGEDRRLAPHGLAGQLLLQEWMDGRFGLRGRVSGQFAVVAGGHHGVPPDHGQMHDLQLRPRLLRHPGAGESLWRQVQYELMDACAEATGAASRLPEWGTVRLPQTVQVVLTAVVILADWIASAPELFPYDPQSWQPAGPVGERRRLRAAWDDLDLPEPWNPEEPEDSPADLFAHRFPGLADAVIRPVQSEAVEMARSMPEPGLLIVEAPMGEGKTEAALAAAEILAARSGAGGLLVALPTRATGDAMFPRLLRWLERLPAGLKEDRRRTVVLAHAKAALNEVWAGLLRRRQPSLLGVDADQRQLHGDADVKPSALHAHQWLRGRKKQLLASFAVATVDQVLFAGLKSRHLALRHLAVAGKVVVIDEVHAYDAYMGRYLDRVLEWLAAYRVPVVLLSATLPQERRRALVAAYAGAEAAKEVETGSDAYPLITAACPSRPVLSARPPAASGRRTQVVLERLDDDLEALADRLERELADGGCALVVRNTVDRVLQTADALRQRLGEDVVTVAHSRFLAADRAAKDAWLLRRFGPDGRERPARHVVVASQVAEQSLDIDFDLLVTDLAPVDLVLQRMGRLHRHRRPRPAPLARPRCLITGVDWSAAPPQPVKGTCAVYRSEYVLLRSIAVLQPYLDGAALHLPDGISPLVQQVYGDQPVGPQAWAERLSELRDAHEELLDGQREKAGAFLLDRVGRPGRPVYGWLEASVGDADDTSTGRAQVRDSAETLEVLVVQRQADGRLTTVPWLDDGRADGRGGLELPTDFAPSRRAAEAVAASALTLPGRFSSPWLIGQTIAELEQFMVPAWQARDCPWLAGELILVLDPDCQCRLAGFQITYSRTDGLRVTGPGVPAAGGDAAGGSAQALREDHQHKGGKSEQGESAAGAAAAVTGRTATAEAGVVSARGSGPGEPPSFNLVEMPWLPVQRADGTVEEVSLLALFDQADGLRRLVGDVPTQEIALLRVLLAVLYDALDGPATIEDWEDLWLSPQPFAPVAAYLERHRDRFDLFHPERPFYQVAGLRTDKGEVAPLARIVADVPVGEPFFAMRRPGVERLTYAEAARWLLHAHAFDTSGIKSAMAGDTRGKAGKVYPLGVGSLGTLGGVFAEGATLRETLLLNLIALEETGAERDASAGTDMPVWRRPVPLGPGERDGRGRARPAGLRDLYTWQSRRIRLHTEDGAVTGVVLGYGDPLALEAPWTLEPMTSWRRSRAQEKKQGRTPVYMPQQHDPSKAAWRGLAALLPASGRAVNRGAPGEPAKTLRSGVVRWFTQLTTTSEIDPGKLVRLRLVGAVYGTQQSVIDEIVDDSVLLPVITLHEVNQEYGAAAVDAVSDAEEAVEALGHLAGNLARAAGRDPAASAATARDLGFGALDGPYRAWLRNLLGFPDLQTAQRQWRATVRGHLERIGRHLLDSAGPAADEGRMIDVPEKGRQLMDAGRAEHVFSARLYHVLGPPQSRAATLPVPAQAGPRLAVPDRAESAR